MRFHKRMMGLQLLWRQNGHVQTLVAAHACDALKLLHPLSGVRKTQRSCDMIVHRIINIIRQRSVHFQTIALHVHDRPRAGKVWAVARRMPRGPGRQFIFFEQHTIGPPGLGQVIEGRGSHDAATDDDHAGSCWKIGHSSILACEFCWRILERAALALMRNRSALRLCVLGLMPGRRSDGPRCTCSGQM